MIYSSCSLNPGPPLSPPHQNHCSPRAPTSPEVFMPTNPLELISPGASCRLGFLAVHAGARPAAEIGDQFVFGLQDGSRGGGPYTFLFRYCCLHLPNPRGCVKVRKWSPLLGVGGAWYSYRSGTRPPLTAESCTAARLCGGPAGGDVAGGALGGDPGAARPAGGGVGGWTIGGTSNESERWTA